LLAWPDAADWKLRISMADITADGPFSAFPGVERWFAVVVGKGVVLGSGGAERRILPGDAPVVFDGAAAPDCRLIDGATRDLNLMIHGGYGGMRALEPNVSWNEGFRVRALFTAVPGRWSDGVSGRDLPEHTLLWDDAATGVAWKFEPGHVAQCAGWWLGYTP
jgi:environmental stress-induced protein Ves